eukprot:Rmarinus@m.27828
MDRIIIILMIMSGASSGSLHDELWSIGADHESATDLCRSFPVEEVMSDAQVSFICAVSMYNSGYILEETLPLFEHATLLEPTNSLYQLRLGEARVWSGMFDEALAPLLASLQLEYNVNSPSVHVLADSLSNLGKHLEASLIFAMECHVRADIKLEPFNLCIARRTSPLFDALKKTVAVAEETKTRMKRCEHQIIGCNACRGVRLVTSRAASDCMAPLEPHLRANKLRYAIKHGYAFASEEDPFIAQDVPRHYTWGKFDVALRHLPHCDWLVWVDMDAVVTNMQTTVEDILLRAGVTDRIHAVFAQPPSDDGLNAGVFFLRNTAWSFRFLEKLQTLTTFFGRYDQDAIRWLIQQSSEWSDHVLIVSQASLFNSLCGFESGQCLWEPGDFIVHFAPPACPAVAIRQFVLFEYPELSHLLELLLPPTSGVAVKNRRMVSLAESCYGKRDTDDYNACFCRGAEARPERAELQKEDWSEGSQPSGWPKGARMDMCGRDEVACAGDLALVTAASEDYASDLFRLLASVKEFEPLMDVIVYDLGLSAQVKEQLWNVHDRVSLRPFHFSRFPPHVALSAGTYAWKPLAIYDTLLLPPLGPWAFEAHLRQRQRDATDRQPRQNTSQTTHCETEDPHSLTSCLDASESLRSRNEFHGVHQDPGTPASSDQGSESCYSAAPDWHCVGIDGDDVRRYRRVLWLDASSVILGRLDPVRLAMQENGFFSVLADPDVRAWVHPGMLDRLPLSEEEQHLFAASSTDPLTPSSHPPTGRRSLNSSSGDGTQDVRSSARVFPSCDGSLLSFDASAPLIRDVLSEWVHCALDESCIAPHGSSKENHRHDQAALSLLLHQRALQSQWFAGTGDCAWDEAEGMRCEGEQVPCARMLSSTPVDKHVGRHSRSRTLGRTSD